MKIEKINVKNWRSIKELIIQAQDMIVVTPMFQNNREAVK